ncbi:hypothetical protein [Nocardioides limicola]|uniref:hypothetical protein n=1 Tax=Nocardioides limicola TaxID=2803368 RepID=UPI00193B9AEC|nr:hypothetical protein [Nocardioides sp. DJM-14]
MIARAINGTPVLLVTLTCWLLAGCALFADEGDGRGHEGAVVAGHFTHSDIKSGPKHGRLVLVDADGQFWEVPTRGMDAGSVLVGDDGLFLADRTDELFVGSDSVTRTSRGAEFDLGEWGGMVAGYALQVFNVGTLGTDDYHFGISAWDGRGTPLVGELTGDIRAYGGCADAGYFVVTNWGDGPADRRLVRVTVTADELDVSTVGPLRAAGVQLRDVELFCVQDSLVSLAKVRDDAGRRVDSIVTIDPVTAAVTVQPLTEVLPSGRYSFWPRGVIGDELVLSRSNEGAVVAVDLATGETRDVLAGDQAAYTTSVGVQGDQVVRWHFYDDADPRIEVVDVATGEVRHDITVTGLRQASRSWDEWLASTPVLVPGDGS